MSHRISIVSSRAIRWMAERQQRRTIRELQRLDDRLLADIGLRRSEIEHVIRDGGRRTGEGQRELIARSSWGIMVAERRLLAARPLSCPLLFALILFSALLSAVVAAGAQSYPGKPIRLIIPFSAGGPNDISARIIADELAKSIGQSIVAENRPGAGGNLAAEAAARSAPDGYTLFWAQAATHGINPSLYRKLGYDALRDFTPVALLVSEPLVLVTGADAPWASVKELVAAAKTEPSKLHFGSGGIGTTPHMAGELFAMQAGVRLAHVPYRGNAPAVVDTIAGRVQLVFDGINSSIGHIRAGTLKALAVTSRKRSPVLPDVPIMADTLPEYDVLSWGGIAIPSGTPADIVARLSQELRAIGARAAVKQRFADLGVHLNVSTPDEMGLFVRSEIERWRRVIAASDLGID